MKGGRLKIVNESSYPTKEVEALVRFGLSEIDLTGERLVVVVKHARKPHSFSGTYWSFMHGGIPRDQYDRYCGKRSWTHHFAVLRIGTPDRFPAVSHRNYAGVPVRVYADWREGLVAIAAHEGKHAEHQRDGAYRTKSGWTTRKVRYVRDDGEVVERQRRIPRRIGVERVEPKCEAFENLMLRRWRETYTQPPQFATVSS